MITLKTTIGEVLRMDRNVAPIFMSYGMRCLWCPHGTMESIADACQGHGVNADELLEKLNAYFAAKETENK